MTLVEGFGDEVLVIFAVLIFVLVIGFVWASTSVSDRPRSTIIIPLPRHEDGPLLIEDALIEEAMGIRMRLDAAGDTPTGSTPNIAEASSSSNQQEQATGRSPDQRSQPESLDLGTLETEEEIRNQPDAIKIKLKYINDSDKFVSARLGEKLVDFKRRNFRVDLAAGKFVRLIYQGRLLTDDDTTLEQHGLFDNCVVHCHVSSNHPSRPQLNQSQSDISSPSNFQHFNEASILAQGEFEIELGNWMMPVAGFLLSILWSYWYQFGHFFSFLATVCLTVLTGLFFTVIVGIYSNLWSGGNNNPVQEPNADSQANAPILVGLWNLNLPIPNFIRHLFGAPVHTPTQAAAN